MPLPSAAESKDALVLIGTVHRSRTASQRLQQLLAILAPVTVTLEFSPYGLQWRLTRAPLLLERLEAILCRIARETGWPLSDLAALPAVTGISDLLALPFEYMAAEKYARAAGAALELIDLSAISARKLNQVEEELVTEENLRILLALPEPDTSPEGAAVARAMVLEDGDGAIRQAFLARRRGEEGIGRRDRHMAEEIRRLLASASGRLVHIGGWVHLIEDQEGETLYSLLAAHHPRRLLLDP